MSRFGWEWVVSLMLLPGVAAAQVDPSLGVELGYSRADFTGSAAIGVARHDGVIAGAWFRSSLIAGLDMQPGIVLANRGGAAAVPSAQGTLRIDVDLVYLDLPLLLRGRLPGPAGTRLVVLGGTAPSLRIGCNVEVQQTGVPLVRQPCAETPGASFREWDVALVVGAGIAIPVERNELSIEAKLMRGLRSVSDAGEVRNRTYAISVLVPF